MSLHNNILTYMIENLGLPLMEAVGHVQKKTATPENDAEMMARLLTSSVNLGMAISSKMNGATDATQAEALRFRLIALAAHALSERAKLKSKEPTDTDIDSLKATIDSLFVFSNNFSVNEQGLQYLGTLGLEDFKAKEYAELSTIEAFLPIVSAMDHKDRGLFPNIAERLLKESDQLAEQFQKESQKPEDAIVFIKQKILSLLVQTFVHIYPDKIENNKSIGDVWQEFDRRKALVLLLMDYLLTGQKNIETSVDQGDSQSVSKPNQPDSSAASSSPPPPPPTQESPVLPKATEASENKKDEDGGSDGSSGGSPLGFFKK